MSNTIKNLLLSLFIGGLAYLLVEIIRPAREYYSPYNGERVSKPTGRFKDKLNWIALGTAICLAGIVIIIQPLKNKE